MDLMMVSKGHTGNINGNDFVRRIKLISRKKEKNIVSVFDFVHQHILNV